MMTFHGRLTPAQHGCIEVYANGDRHTTMAETLSMVEEWLPLLGTESKILYLNSLSNERELNREVQKRFARTPAEQTKRLLTQYLRPDQILDHLDFFEALIKDENVKVVFLNCFELAALTPSRQSKLTAFLKVLKDVYGVHVVISMITQPGSNIGGGKGILTFLADFKVETGSWLMSKSSERQYKEAAKAEAAEDNENTRKPEQILPPPPLDFRTGVPNYDLPSFMKNQEAALKLKELEEEFGVMPR